MRGLLSGRPAPSAGPRVVFKMLALVAGGRRRIDARFTLHGAQVVRAMVLKRPHIRTRVARQLFGDHGSVHETGVAVHLDLVASVPKTE